MKHILTTLTIFCSSLLIAQEPISKSIGEFTTLKAYDLINVELIKSDENRVEISGRNAEDVVVVNKNGKLKIKMNTDEMFDGNRTQIKLYYTGVDLIDANEGAFISSSDTIEQYELEMKSQEGGHIKLDINVRIAESRAVTGGIVELTGSTNNQNIKMGTGGVFKGKDFASVTTKVSITAGGEADINASELADIRIKAGGDVYIYGDPNTVNESRAIGGRIKRMQ